MNIIPVKQNNLSKLNIDTLISEWLEYERKANDAVESTINTYRKGMNVFLDWLDIGLEYVTPSVIMDFKSDLRKKYSVQTINLYLSCVKSFYRFCVNEEYTVVNPALNVRGFKRPNNKLHKKDALSNAEIINVLNQPDTSTLGGLRDKVILVLFSHCALRSIEIHKANIEDLRTKDDRLILELQGKSRLELLEYVIIPVAQEQLVNDYLRERLKVNRSGPLFISVSKRSKANRLALSSIRNMVKSYFAESGIVSTRKTTHSLRHSAITNAIDNGATPLQVQSMARHISFDTTLIYFHEYDRMKGAAEDLINYE